MKRHVISALVTALSAVLASLSLLLLDIDWNSITNAQEAFVALSGVLVVALRAGVKVLVESFVSSKE